MIAEVSLAKSKDIKKIAVEDINKITLPLTYNGTMNITATKIIE